MGKICIRILFPLWVFLVFASSAISQEIAPEEARRIAADWVDLVVLMTGGWGGRSTSTVGEVEPLVTNERTVGFLCHVEPEGFVAVSAYRGLAPVRAHSETSSLLATSTEGGTAFLKGKMLGIILETENRLGGDVGDYSAKAIAAVLDMDCKKAWELLGESGAYRKASKTNYVEGGWMLETDWHQSYPYNHHCPVEDCPNDPYGRTVVGCTATAAAQIMRHWSWPPNFDWTLMPDTLVYASSIEEIEEVSRLCHNVGYEAGADYGCDNTSIVPGGAPFDDDMADAFKENFHFHTNIEYTLRDHTHSDDEWWNMAVYDLDRNRPLLYHIDDSGTHSLVLDGYRIYNGTVRQFHLNYGWEGAAFDHWYTTDEIYGSGSVYTEGMMRHIRPYCNEGVSIADGDHFPWPGDPPWGAPYIKYIYYDRDVVGSNATHYPGWKIQFLPGVHLTGTSTTTHTLQYQGTIESPTRLFTYHNGRMSNIKIQGGAIILQNGGGVRLQ